MRIYNSDGNPETVPGIYLYKVGLELTKGDYIIHGRNQKLLYLVNADHISSSNNPPEYDRTLYTEYSLLNALNDSDDLTDPDNDNRLVTGSILKSFVNKYIKGINDRGNVQVKNISSSQDFKPTDYVETCIYKLNITGTSVPTSLPSSSTEVIFKCYRSYNDVIQEILDYKEGQIYLTNFTVNSNDEPSVNQVTWYPVSVNDAGLISSINRVNSKINSVYNIFTKMNRVGMYDISKYIVAAEHPTQIVIPNSELGLLPDIKYMELVITFETSNDSVPQQEVIRLNMIDNSETIVKYEFSVERTTDNINDTTVITISNNVDLEFIEITKAIIVK